MMGRISGRLFAILTALTIGWPWQDVQSHLRLGVKARQLLTDLSDLHRRASGYSRFHAQP